MGSSGASGETCAQAFAEAIAKAGADPVFGLMGDGNMHLLIALRERGVEVIEVRHEGAAVAMAEGFGWSSGRPGVCSVTHGPGLSHVATSLLVAARNRSPLVVLAAETPSGYAGAQRFDQAAFVASCEAEYRRMSPREHPAAVLDEALSLARDLSRPVVLGVAADLLTAAAAPATTPRPPRHPRPGPTAADNLAAARRTAALLDRSERPVLIAGRGALRGDSADLMRALAEHTGAALATTVPAKGLFDGHRLDLGIAGGLAHPAAERVLHAADLVTGIGASMGRSTTRSMRLFPDAHVVQVIDDLSGTPTIETWRGDAADTLRRTLELVRSRTSPRPPWFTPVGAQADCWQEDLATFAPTIPAGTADPRRVVAAISKLLPEDALVVVSNGHCSGFASAFLTVPARGRFFAAHGFGSIGQALPTAIGAAAGAPGRKVVVFEGDAAFMMHAQEVDTAARAQADLTLFVLNDEALGTEYHRLLAAGSDAAAAVVRPPDLAAVAGALGARSATIDGEDVDRIAAAALRPGLAVVDVRTARTVLSRHMRLPAIPAGVPSQAQARIR